MFRELRPSEALRVLRRNSVGRLAYTLHDRVEVVPVYYVTDGDWLYVRTSPGIKIGVLAHNRWLAFQTDEVESMLSWRSVMVRGSAYLLSEGATTDLVRRYRRAVARLSAAIPGAFTEHDPVPFRTVILGIHIDDITGREARPGSTGNAARRRLSGGRERKRPVG